ncbi:MAG: helix-turn-helix domain-containing protein [Verrucomicrobia bacterium]|nr:helix-turn-helix domain-containing protein [Verrucomicrobiota bacterium]
MEMEGKVWKSGKVWLVQIPALDAMTQGKTRKEVLKMAEDLVFEMAQSYFNDDESKDFAVAVIDYKQGVIGVTCNNNKLLLALSLRRQREKSGSTVREASERLGSKSPNAYAQYERGRTNISLDRYEELLMAANPFEQRRLRIV